MRRAPTAIWPTRRVPGRGVGARTVRSRAARPRRAPCSVTVRAVARLQRRAPAPPPPPRACWARAGSDRRASRLAGPRRSRAGRAGSAAGPRLRFAGDNAGDVCGDAGRRGVDDREILDILCSVSRLVTVLDSCSDSSDMPPVSDASSEEPHTARYLKRSLSLRERLRNLIPLGWATNGPRRSRSAAARLRGGHNAALLGGGCRHRDPLRGIWLSIARSFIPSHPTGSGCLPPCNPHACANGPPDPDMRAGAAS
jgi:hypothetical protein